MNMAASAPPAGPLAGVKVIEWGANYTVPLAAQGLADQGADVIKVEPPSGDGTRHATAKRRGVHGLSASFMTANRNKRSVVLDMKRPGAADAFRALARDADVVMQNFRPGVVEGLSLGYDDLKDLNPRLIYVSVSGFGRAGPYAKQRVWDPVVQAVSGIMASQGDPETGEPCQIRTSIADKVTAMVVFQAVTAALFARERTGTGQHIEIDMLGASLAFSWTDAMFNHVWQGEDVELGADLRKLRLIYRAKDGQYLCASAISDPEWAALTDALGRGDLAGDPRFKDTFHRLRNSADMYRELSPAFLAKRRDEWLEILRARDTVCAPVNTEANLVDDPQVVAAGLVLEDEHPQGGRYRHVAHPARFGATPAEMRRHPPTLGEHTEEVLRAAGVSGEAIAELKTAGALGA